RRLLAVAKGSIEEVDAALHGSTFKEGAIRCPPLSCRTSPPQGGRLAVSTSRLFFKHWRLAKTGETADLPPSGGDVRQDRGGQHWANTFTIVISRTCPLPGSGGPGSPVRNRRGRRLRSGGIQHPARLCAAPRRWPA